MIDYTGKDQSWWPNLKGRTVAILASGPSMCREQCEAVRDTNWFAIAINNTWQIAPWAQVLYGCDWHWWRSDGAPNAGDYRGLCVVGHLPVEHGKRQLPANMQWQASRLRYAPVHVGMNELVMDGPHIGSGSNSGFQAANLAMRWGAREIILLGVDCHSPKEHWHGRHTHPEAPVMTERNCERWVSAWKASVPKINALGVRVTNCSPGSALTVFPRMEISDYIARASNA